MMLLLGMVSAPGWLYMIEQDINRNSDCGIPMAVRRVRETLLYLIQIPASYLLT
jgi:hypothetical protein